MSRAGPKGGQGAATGVAERKPKSPVGTTAYEALRDLLVRGELRPNEPLIEADLAARLDISRTPIREALQRLAADGLIVARRRGWAVREYGADEIRDIYETRAALEGYGARLAAIRGSDEQLEEVVRIHQQEKDVLPALRDRLVVMNVAFHDAILDAGGNPRIKSILERSREYYFNHQIATLYSDEETRHSNAGHDRIVAALLDRDPERASFEAREHVEEALQVLLTKIR